MLRRGANQSENVLSASMKSSLQFPHCSDDINDWGFQSHFVASFYERFTFDGTGGSCFSSRRARLLVPEEFVEAGDSRFGDG